MVDRLVIMRNLAIVGVIAAGWVGLTNAASEVRGGIAWGVRVLILVAGIWMMVSHFRANPLRWYAIKKPARTVIIALLAAITTLIVAGPLFAGTIPIGAGVLMSLTLTGIIMIIIAESRRLR